MKKDGWTEEEVLELSKDRAALVRRLVEGLAGQRGVVFAARFGYGIPPVDMVTVDVDRTLTGYILRLPVVEGRLSPIPLYQGFGESIFVVDQMFDESYLIFPDIEFPEYNPFTVSPNTAYRMRKEAYESGVALFDRDFNVRVFVSAKGSLAAHYWRLKLELMDWIARYGDDVVVGKGMEKEYEGWRRWVEKEFEGLGGKRLLDEAAATEIIKKALAERNYHQLRLRLTEGEVEGTPRGLPVFNVQGRGFYLGDEKEFSLQISRISGRILKGDF
ncbi:MAG: hypothetical protein D6733_07075 [Methanobacteriota archaeon]|nr:MAG: hypothetical protein D6733_07075 [Euryarchaeota archaeon]